MAQDGSYFVVLTIGVVLTLVVGQILLRTGSGFLSDSFSDSVEGQRAAESANRMVTVLFHLVVLGSLTLLSTIRVSGSVVQNVIVGSGVILLAVGVAFGLTMLGLSQIRARHRSEEVQEEIQQQIAISRGRPPTPPGGGGRSSQQRSVIEMGPGGPVR